MEIELHIEELETERRWDRLRIPHGHGTVVGRFLSFQNDQTFVWLDAFATREERLAAREAEPENPFVLRSTVRTLTPAFGSTITQIDEFERMKESPVIEVRQYRIRPGMRERFAVFLRNRTLAEHVRLGMPIYGQFDALEDDNLFVFFRGFPDLLERDRRKADFYQSRLWLEELQDEAFSMIEDYKNVLLVTPVILRE